jgi:hypothetical protein
MTIYRNANPTGLPGQPPTMLMTQAQHQFAEKRAEKLKIVNIRDAKLAGYGRAFEDLSY